MKAAPITGLTRATVAELLMSNDRAVGRALVVLRNRQTYDERQTEQTRHLNGRGFRPAHAKKGTSMADFFERRGFLTPKQVAYWRRPMADGNPRIVVYWAQLVEEAEVRALARQPSRTSKTGKSNWDEVVADELDERRKHAAHRWMEDATDARMAG